MGSERWVSGVIFILSLGYLACSFFYPLGSPISPGPGFFPLFIGVIWSILAGLIVINNWQSRKTKKAVLRWKLSNGITRAAVLLAGVAVFIISLPVVGYLISTIILTFFLLKVFATEKIMRPAIYSIAWGIVTYLLFVKLLKIPFPN
jgi:putative tricarboxylic transport membrane protein